MCWYLVNSDRLWQRDNVSHLKLRPSKHAYSLLRYSLGVLESQSVPYHTSWGHCASAESTFSLLEGGEENGLSSSLKDRFIIYLIIVKLVKRFCCFSVCSTRRGPWIQSVPLQGQIQHNVLSGVGACQKTNNHRLEGGSCPRVAHDAAHI